MVNTARDRFILPDSVPNLNKVQIGLSLHKVDTQHTSGQGKIESNFLRVKKNQQLFFKNRIHASQFKHSIKTPYNLIKKIGFIFFRNDYKFFTDSIIKKISEEKE